MHSAISNFDEEEINKKINVSVLPNEENQNEINNKTLIKLNDVEKTDEKQKENDDLSYSKNSISSTSSDSSSISSNEDKKKIEFKPLKIKKETSKNTIEENINNCTNNTTITGNNINAKKSKKKEKTRKTRKNRSDWKTLSFDNVGISLHFLIDYNELEFIEKVGEGGYGEVYYGKWLGQEVAIKQYGKSHSKFHKKKIADFIKEVEVISNLRHPNIVLYMGVCINYSKYLMITEYLQGGSLFDILHKKQIKLTEDRVILICEDIALGMNYLHSRKVFHCDLKSSNILIDSNWNIKLCDFGLSRQEGRVGTPHWMAPEILRQEKYDEYSDVYSYGMILWEITSNEIPHQNLSHTQIIGIVGFEKYQIPIPQKGIPLILKIMEKCLNRDRTKRPNFKEIVEWLQVNNREKEKKRYVIKELDRFFGN